jgi:hypothetical protein
LSVSTSCRVTSCRVTACRSQPIADPNHRLQFLSASILFPERFLRCQDDESLMTLFHFLLAP